jgi:hypothetical protein
MVTTNKLFPECWPAAPPGRHLNYTVYGVDLSEYIIQADLTTHPMDRFLAHRDEGLFMRKMLGQKGLEEINTST